MADSEGDFRAIAADGASMVASYGNLSLHIASMATVTTPLADPSGSDNSDGHDPLRDDPRLELVDRITRTPAFQKAVKLQALLRFIVEQSLQDDAPEVTEHRIGNEVFGKGPEYSPLLDSSVRVQARQLRLKLHEYFDGVGKDEPLILEIPKGSYRPIFRKVVEDTAVSASEPVPVVIQDLPESNVFISEHPQPRPRFTWMPWTIAAICTVVLVGMAIRSYWYRERTVVPWPLALVLGQGEVGHIVLADSAYQITATANSHSITLNEYLRTKPRNNAAIDPNDPADVRLSHALTGGTFTSFADVVLVDSLATIAGRHNLSLDIKSARDLDPRDLEDGNFIFSGSPSSNPWVNLYSSKLNFREEEDPSRPGGKSFINLHPQGNEPKLFTGSSSEDSVRVDYADLAVVPGLGDHGTVMIVQGLRHEATEAVARMLADPDGSRMITDALRSAGDKVQPAYFEAIFSVRAVAGIPKVTGVEAIRTPRK